MSNIKLIKDSLSFRDDTVEISLYYPDVIDNEISKVEIALIDVRAADNIRVSYDKDRDGWVVEQASKFEWPPNDIDCDSDWQEVSFIAAWARSKQ